MKHVIVHLAILIFLTGCGTAVSSGTSTALDGADLVAMTDDMAMKIVADADVQSAIAKEGKLAVVVLPVENRMQAEVLPRGPAEAFTARLRGLLAKHAPDRFTWLMNRDAFYRLRAKEIDADLGPDPDRIQPRYSLTATFSSLADESHKRRTSYYLCVYELKDVNNGALLWTDKYEIKKTSVRGFLD